jgi:MYXO-CTERM domain-containing protein
MTTRFCRGLALLSLGLASAEHARAQVDWEGLPEGRWTVVSSNTIADLDPCPSRDCSYSAVEGQSGVINDWCGGAFAAGHGELGGLVAWGGGHNGYFGSEVYVFDLASGEWERRSEPYDDGSDSVAAQCNDDGVYPDGSACPTHTYDQVDYHPATNRFVILGGTPDPVCGGCVDDRVHLFDLTDSSWQLGAQKDGPVYYGGTSAYDAERDLFWLLSAYAHSFASYDPVADAWTDYGSPGNVEIDGAGAIDPERDLYLFIDALGSGNVYAIPLDAPDSDFVELSVEGDVEIQSANKLGFDRDASTGRFVAWDDGPDLFLLDAPSGDWRTGTWRWTRVAPDDASVSPTRNPNGTYGRLRYAASVNAFVLVSSTEGPVWAYRVSPGAGTGQNPEPAQPDGGMPDGGAAGVSGAGMSGAGVSGGGTSSGGVSGGAMSGGGGSAPAGASGMSGAGAGGSVAMPVSDTSDADGCGCRVASRAQRGNAMLGALLVAALTFVRVARRRVATCARGEPPG